MKLFPNHGCGNSPKNQLVHDFCLAYLVFTCSNPQEASLPMDRRILELYEKGPWVKADRGKVESIEILCAISHGKMGMVEYSLQVEADKVSLGKAWRSAKVGAKKLCTVPSDLVRAIFYIFQTDGKSHLWLWAPTILSICRSIPSPMSIEL